jgi:hypothetical protein
MKGDAMLIREYHGHQVISAREERPQPDGDGWDHLVVYQDGTVSGVLPALADAIGEAKARKFAVEESERLKVNEANLAAVEEAVEAEESTAEEVTAEE